MTFPNVVFEQQRVAAAAAVGLDLDPRTRGDLAVTILLTIVYGIDMMAVVFLLWNRKYPPIKSKGPLLMTSLFICSTLWFVGDLQVNGHVPLANTAFTDCRGFGFWVRVLLGICGVCAVIALRSYALYHVFRLRMPTRGIRFYLPFAIYLSCILVYGIVASVLPPRKSLEYMEGLDVCHMDQPFKITIYVFVWVTGIFVGYINWQIRRIKSSFNEAREMAFGCFIIFSVLTINTTVQFIHPYYPLSLRFRITSTVLDHVCTNAVWWVIMAKPLFQCLFRRQQYLDEWMGTLRGDGLQREYNLSSYSGTVGPDELSGGRPANPHKLYKQSFFYGEDGGEAWKMEDGKLGVPPKPFTATFSEYSSDGRLTLRSLDPTGDQNSTPGSVGASHPAPTTLGDIYGYYHDRHLL